ncbi:MAG TPA: phosphatase PAP2 family protein [Mycobacteriales bacterium]|nr:phosphatase PAP2 family protein [Mycobacteriales bacterium]
MVAGPDAQQRQPRPPAEGLRRFGLRATLAAVALLLVAVPFAALLVEVRRSGPLLEVDRSVAETLHAAVRDRDALLLVLEVVTAIGTFLGLGMFVVVGAAVLWRARRTRLLAFLLVTAVGGWLLNNGVKLAVGRQRPTFEDPLATAHGLSFPSGHAMNSVSVLGALLLVFLPAVAPPRRTPVFAATVLLAVSIGFTRLALGVHYLTDVVAGFILGLAWLSACVALFSVWRVERGRGPVDPLEGLEPEAGPALKDAAEGVRPER